MHFHNICSDKVKDFFVQEVQETDYQQPDYLDNLQYFIYKTVTNILSKLK